MFFCFFIIIFLNLCLFVVVFLAEFQKIDNIK